jgi:hypothetical protein
MMVNMYGWAFHSNFLETLIEVSVGFLHDISDDNAGTSGDACSTM